MSPEAGDSSSALLVDLGNTRVKWASCVGGQIGPMAAEPHGGDVEGLLASRIWKQDRPGALLCASVAGPEFQEALAGAARSHWDLAAHFSTVGAVHGRLRNGYTRPAQMGVDRWLALVGAVGQCAGPFAVIDAGTAITVDVVDPEGAHLGGWIFPGSGLMYGSLRMGTARVSPPQLDSPPRWGQDTAGCVAAGIAAAVSGAVRTLETLLNDSDLSGPLFLTGGDAATIGPLLTGECRLQPDLVLRGLRDVDAQA